VGSGLSSVERKDGKNVLVSEKICHRKEPQSKICHRKELQPTEQAHLPGDSEGL
jgi:hypothetical protein